MLGAVAGAWLATREAKRRGHNPEIVWDLLTYLVDRWNYRRTALAYPYAAAFLWDHCRLVFHTSTRCACHLEGWAGHSGRCHWWVDCFVFLCPQA